jgi:hypothetical protein
MSEQDGSSRRARGIFMFSIGRPRNAGKWLTILLACQLASCGTLLYPERRGQPAGRLDAGVVVLDGVGLLLFLVPGVIAFAVDFATGTIYLPPERPYAVAPAGRSWQTVQIPAAALTPQRLEVILGEQTGQSIRLEPGTYRAARINEIQECTPTAINDLQSSPGSSHVIFRGTSE